MTATNNNTLAGSLPELATAHDALASAAADMGILFHIADYGGLRDEATTEQLIAWRDQAVAAGQDYYRVAPYGHSYHDFGGAFDVRVDDDGGLADPLAVLGRLAPAAGLRWGGTFPPPADTPHFELAIDIGDLKGRWAAYQAQPSQAGPGQGGGAVLGVLLAAVAAYALVRGLGRR